MHKHKLSPFLRLVILINILQPLALAADEPLNAKGYVLKTRAFSARIVPETLSITKVITHSHDYPVALAEALETPEAVTDTHFTGDSLSWNVPSRHLAFKITVETDKLHVVVQTDREQLLTWPVTGRDNNIDAIIYPYGEGLFIPVSDPFWLKRMPPKYPKDVDNNYPEADVDYWFNLTPFYGYEIKGNAGAVGTVTYIIPNDVHTRVWFHKENGRIYNVIHRKFQKADKFMPFELLISMTSASPIAPALECKDWLIGQNAIKPGTYVSLDEKIIANPEVKKLLGASHAYLWYDARLYDLRNIPSRLLSKGLRHKQTNALVRLRALGMDKMWLGYDLGAYQLGFPIEPDLNNPPPDLPKNTDWPYVVSRHFVQQATQMGYLIGPYDLLRGIDLKPGTRNLRASWPGLDINSVIWVHDQGRLVPYQQHSDQHNEFYVLSSQFLKKRLDLVRDRLDRDLIKGDNTFFLDVDGGTFAIEDDNPDHFTTQAEDRQNRRDKMKYISERAVLGTETGYSYYAPAIAFAFEENITHHLASGDWSFHPRPSKIFARRELPESAIKENYDPVYKLPLYQAVFHGSVVTTDRWNTSLSKFSNEVLFRRRCLFRLLYNAPFLWNLDLKEIEQNGGAMSSLHKFFSPIHQAVGTKPLTSFEWLTEDKMVQRTRFGDEIEMTANFRDKGDSYEGIKCLCVRATWRKENRSEDYCPPVLTQSEEERPAPRASGGRSSNRSRPRQRRGDRAN
jgi:hypothetical protein